MDFFKQFETPSETSKDKGKQDKEKYRNLRSAAALAAAVSLAPGCATVPHHELSSVSLDAALENAQERIMKMSEQERRELSVTIDDRLKKKERQSGQMEYGAFDGVKFGPEAFSGEIVLPDGTTETYTLSFKSGLSEQEIKDYVDKAMDSPRGIKGDEITLTFNGEPVKIWMISPACRSCAYKFVGVMEGQGESWKSMECRIPNPYAWTRWWAKNSLANAPGQYADIDRVDYKMYEDMDMDTHIPSCTITQWKGSMEGRVDTYPINPKKLFGRDVGHYKKFLLP